MVRTKPLSFFAPENVYVDESGFRSLLVTIRRDLKNEFYSQDQYLRFDLACSDIGIETRIPDFATVTPSANRGNTWIFKHIYGYIKNTNVVVSRLDNIEWDDENVRNSILAEALFYRSYWYYRLIMTYGDVPWIGEELTGAKLDFYSHSRWAILNKIQSDMEFAAEWLPETANIGEVTKYAAYHLLTKIYIANTEFDKAIEAATNIIDGPFELMTERFGSWKDDPNRNVLWDLHRVENKNLPENTETIFTTVDRYEAPENARSEGNYLARVYGPHYWTLVDASGARGFNYFNEQADSVGQGGAYTRTGWFYNYLIWKEFGYNWQTTPDLRRADINWLEMTELIFSVPTSPNFGEPATYKYLPNKQDTSFMWYPWPFYKIFMPPEFGKPEGIPRGGNGDMYVFRLAETYLLRAEAYYWSNKPGLAVADINKIRRRANAVEISQNDVTIDYIFHERARELHIEEPRHSELVRVANIMAKLNIDGYSLDNIHENNWFYDRVMEFNTLYQDPPLSFKGGPPARIFPYNIYWPIPNDVITENTMGVINQNLGYIGAEKNLPPLESIEENGEE